MITIYWQPCLYGMLAGAPDTLDQTGHVAAVAGPLRALLEGFHVER